MSNELDNLRIEIAVTSRYDKIADLFKLLADSTRIKILYCLYHKELCVQELTLIMNVSTSLISHQLRQLKVQKIVKYRRQGRYVYYSIADEHIKKVLEMAFSHILIEK